MGFCCTVTITASASRAAVLKINMARRSFCQWPQKPQQYDWVGPEDEGRSRPSRVPASGGIHKRWTLRAAIPSAPHRSKPPWLDKSFRCIFRSRQNRRFCWHGLPSKIKIGGQSDLDFDSPPERTAWGDSSRSCQASRRSTSTRRRWRIRNGTGSTHLAMSAAPGWRRILPPHMAIRPEGTWKHYASYPVP